MVGAGGPEFKPCFWVTFGLVSLLPCIFSAISAAYLNLISRENAVSMEEMWSRAIAEHAIDKWDMYSTLLQYLPNVVAPFAYLACFRGMGPELREFGELYNRALGTLVTSGITQINIVK